MSEPIQFAEDVAREAMGCVMRWQEAAGEFACMSPAHHDEDCDLAVDHVMAVIRARDAEVAEQVRAETLAGFDAFAILLAATREGLARSGSRAKGVEQVREMLAEHAGAIARANEDANDRMRRGRPHWNRPWEPVEP